MACYDKEKNYVYIRVYRHIYMLIISFYVSFAHHFGHSTVSIAKKTPSVSAKRKGPYEFYEEDFTAT